MNEQIERLRADITEAASHNMPSILARADDVKALLSALDEAVEALRPFAHAAFEADGYPDSEVFTLVLRDDDFEGVANGSEVKCSLITARQIRRARDFLARYEGGK